RDEALAAARRLVRVAEEVGGALDVLDDELLVRLLDRGAAAGQCRDGLLVVAGPSDGLVEDRGVRGEPREPVAFDERAQRAVDEPRAPDLVQVDGLAVLLQPQERVHLCSSRAPAAGAWRAGPMLRPGPRPGRPGVSRTRRRGGRSDRPQPRGRSQPVATTSPPRSSSRARGRGSTAGPLTACPARSGSNTLRWQGQVIAGVLVS